VALCGRILTRRVFGKLAFFTVQDSSGTFQLYLEKKRLGDTFKPFLARTDAGDIVGVRGSVKRTDKGELSVCECSRKTNRRPPSLPLLPLLPVLPVLPPLCRSQYAASPVSAVLETVGARVFTASARRACGRRTREHHANEGHPPAA
jgi:hypothetical protein